MLKNVEFSLLTVIGIARNSSAYSSSSGSSGVGVSVRILRASILSIITSFPNPDMSSPQSSFPSSMIIFTFLGLIPFSFMSLSFSFCLIRASVGNDVVEVIVVNAVVEEGGSCSSRMTLEILRVPENASDIIGKEHISLTKADVTLRLHSTFSMSLPYQSKM